MPELPESEAYLAALGERILNERLEGVRLASPFLLRSVEPGLNALQSLRVTELERLGKRSVFAFEDEHESNYCARCQTGGRLLADRALSRLLKDDWPKTLEELE